MNPGIKNEVSVMVTDALSAKAMGSGTLAVYATPAMIALMEQTAAESVEGLVEEGKTTVGTKIDAEHLAATPVGMKVTCKSELIDVDNRRLVFRIEAFDEAGLIGKAHHERFIIDQERFIEKTYRKLEK